MDSHLLKSTRQFDANSVAGSIMAIEAMLRIIVAELASAPAASQEEYLSLVRMTRERVEKQLQGTDISSSSKDELAMNAISDGAHATIVNVFHPIEEAIERDLRGGA